MIETKHNWYRIRLIGRRRLFLFFALCVIAQVSYGQEGCLDPQALNFDPSATISNGNCEYPETNLTAVELATLPADLVECSGFVETEEFYVAINDSGSGPSLFLLDKTTFAQQQLLSVTGATNVDWEELAMDENFLYIGDMGNISGVRTDLKIYRIPIATLGTDPVVMDTISFSYADQTDFTPQLIMTPYDCEAFIVKEDTLHLFTKGWDNNYSKHYKLPNQVGEQEAILVDSFFVDALITGATVIDDSLLMLTGYGNESLCWLFKDFQDEKFFSGNKRRIGLGPLGQNETVTWIGEGSCLVTTEGGLAQGKVFEFNFLDLVTSLENVKNDLNVEVYPNPFSEIIHIQNFGNENLDAVLYDQFGKILTISTFNDSENLQLSHLPVGIYYLHLTQGKKQQIKKMQKL